MIIFHFLNILYHVTLYICAKISQKKEIIYKSTKYLVESMWSPPKSRWSTNFRAHHELTRRLIWSRPMGFFFSKSHTRIHTDKFSRVTRLNGSGTCVYLHIYILCKQLFTYFLRTHTTSWTYFSLLRSLKSDSTIVASLCKKNSSLIYSFSFILHSLYLDYWLSLTQIRS